MKFYCFLLGDFRHWTAKYKTVNISLCTHQYNLMQYKIVLYCSDHWLSVLKVFASELLNLGHLEANIGTKSIETFEKTLSAWYTFDLYRCLTTLNENFDWPKDQTTVRYIFLGCPLFIQRIFDRVHSGSAQLYLTWLCWH